MRLNILKNDDEGYAGLFQRLIEKPPAQIFVFEPNTNPVKQETDIYFYFPCDKLEHAGHNCGFFSWVLSIKTNRQLFVEIEEIRRARKCDEETAAKAIKENYDWNFSLVIAKDELNEQDIINNVQDWLVNWVEELSLIPVKLVSLLDHRRMWAFYEEFHPVNAEELDPFYQAMRELLTDHISVNGVNYSRADFNKRLKEQLDKEQEKPNDDG